MYSDPVYYVHYKYNILYKHIHIYDIICINDIMIYTYIGADNQFRNIFLMYFIYIYIKIDYCL